MNKILKDFKLLGRVKDLKSPSFVWPKDLNDGGVYLIVYEGKETPQFIIPGCGPEKYEGREVNVNKDKLEENWICLGFNRNIIYIGKAGKSNTLKKRLKLYMRFGCGEEVSHYGGRYIWQIKDSDNLLVFWKKSDNPERDESNMLRDFKTEYKELPFANLKMEKIIN